MKKIISFIFPLAVLFSACIQEELQDNQALSADGRIFTAAFDHEESRTYIEDGKLLRWNAGDQISIFEGNTLNRQYQFDGETGDNSGTFSIVNKPFGTGNDLDRHYAVYPYVSDTRISENGVITVDLPASQNYAAESFGLGANTMVAVTKDIDDTFLKFRNVCGYLKLQLYGENITVKTITLTGNNDEKLAGKASITIGYEHKPAVSMANDATASITLNCGEAIQIGTTAETATDFWFVVPPTAFESGLSVTVTDSRGNTFSKVTNKDLSIERNVITPMKALEVVIEDDVADEEIAIPDNQIWYTSNDGNIVTPNNESAAFGANIISNTYENGKGIIVFDSELTNIGSDFFPSNHTLTSITIPYSVESIEAGAFGTCYELKEFRGKYASSDGRYLSKDNIFLAYANASGTDFTIPDDVTTIASGAFVACPLISITIPDNIDTIEPGAIICPLLNTIIGKYASEDNRCYIIDGTLCAFARSGVREYMIPDGVSRIKDRVFASSFELESVTIPESVNAIEYFAFYNCRSLKAVYCTAQTPPAAVLFYHNWEAFEDATIYVPAESVYEYRKAAGWKYYADKIVAFDYDMGEAVISNNIIHYTSIDGNIVEPSSTNSFGAQIVSNTYENNRGTIVFDRDIITIPRDAFRQRKTLASIVIPDSVTEIESCAFYECSNLSDLAIGNNVAKIGQSAFSGCSNITSVHITDIESWCNIKFYDSSSNPIRHTSSLYLNGELLTDLVIPDGITAVEDYAFESCTSLTSVTISDCVSSIGKSAFEYCTSLTSIAIPDCVTSIGESAFESCINLLNVTIGDSVTSIEKRAFVGCENLKSLTIPSSVTSIGEGAFIGCGLEEFKGELAAADGRCLIKDNTLIAYAYGSGSEYSIPNNVTTIGKQTFSYCWSLTQIIIPDSVTTIEDEAFIGCEYLTNVTLGNNVASIGYSAFEWCPLLTNIYCRPTTPPTVNWTSFDTSISGRKIYVPRDSANAYKSADDWSDYASDIVAYDF